MKTKRQRNMKIYMLTEMKNKTNVKRQCTQAQYARTELHSRIYTFIGNGREEDGSR